MTARKNTASTPAPAPEATLTTPAAPAAPTAPALTFADAEIPEAPRKASPVNPMREVCTTLAATFDPETGKSKAKSVQAADDKMVRQIKRWLADLGTDLGYTFRSVVSEGNLVTFWAVTKIVHRTPEEIAAAKAAKEAADKAETDKAETDKAAEVVPATA